ncbi:cytochrome d ubiquinol oxidase subunit II [Glycomyces sp. A-F 0318]|uniref:cytochrome d ubiquinol oxidase subunit II n=1 Tax=Glycomyces amatae TaxID=2881355 RepID=UPI001E57CBB4|nr:cytochrome d ubiquinol oxidase subunit II [Glycomyces amatae]MCD0445979.1 cytochrome d ubiquinol oxidase subunit II [Glycomyces amatae]
MATTTIGFTAIAVLLTGYLVLESRDFGIGALLPVLGRGDRERRLMADAAGPVWDGNEFWLVAAAAAMLTAFPHWYASFLSGFYPLLFPLLAALVARTAALARRRGGDGRRARAWDWCTAAASAAAAFLWGAVLANLVRGVPLDADFERTGSAWGLLNGYALLGGLTTLLLCCSCGAAFLHLTTGGGTAERARALARRLGAAAALPALAFLLWTQLSYGDGATLTLTIIAAAALLAAPALDRADRARAALAARAAAIGLASAVLFCALWPDLLPSTGDAANSLTRENAAATGKTLGITAWAALAALPLLLAHQAWTYRVLRSRPRAA